MTVHASEVAQIVKAALDEDSQVGEVELVAHTPNPDAYYANRDGRYEYVCAGRDCVRGFRVTVEAIPFEDVDRLAHRAIRGSVLTAASPLDVLVEVTKPQPDWHSKAEQHRQMARAAIRVALRHGIESDEIMAEYEDVQEVERLGR